MSTSHSNYKRTIRAHKRNAGKAGCRVDDWMRLRALGGCPAAQQWCKAKGIEPFASADDIPTDLRNLAYATTWWVVFDRGAAEVEGRGPFKVEPHAWDEGLTVQDMTGSHGTALHYYTEAEALAEYDRLEAEFAALHKARLLDELEHERRVSAAQREHVEDMERLGLGPL